MRKHRRRIVLGVGTLLVAAALAGCTAAPGTWFRPSTPTISIAASTACPAELRSARDVPDTSGVSTTLLPKTAAASDAMACSYTNRKLVAQTRLGPQAADELASVVNKIDLTAPAGNFSCPAALDLVTILAFRFGYADDIDLWWNDSGCQTLDNGRLGAFEGANPSFYVGFEEAYTRLVPAPATPAG